MGTSKKGSSKKENIKEVEKVSRKREDKVRHIS